MNFVIPMLGLTAHGGNRVLVAMANVLVAGGHQCSVLTPQQSLPSAMPFKFDARVEVRYAGPEISNKTLRWTVFALYLSWALRGRDIIANHFVTGVAARIAQLTSRARVIYLVQDIEFRFYGGMLRLVARWLCEWTYRLPLLLPSNSYLEDELRKLGAQPLPALKLGVDRIFFEQPAAAGPKQFDVVCFPRREKHKRLDRLLQIAERIKKSGATVTAISQDKGLLAECAPAISAAFTPASDSALIEVLDRSRLLLLTSEQEGFALPPLEAMARGLPCVIFPCGGPGVYASDGQNCLLIADESVDTAAMEILRLLGDQLLYERLAANARSTAAQFKFETGLSELVPRLEKLLAGAA